MEEQIGSHISDLEGLNSELEGFLADLRGREEGLSSRIQELEEELELHRCVVAERDAQLLKAARAREGLEKQLALAAQESSRCEEGFLGKVELVRKELRAQEKRAEELERKLAAAGGRLEDALADAAGKGKALAQTEGRLLEAERRLKELYEELERMNSGRMHETASAMAGRVEELERTLGDDSARYMEKLRLAQAELGAAKAELRATLEENSSLRARADTVSRELCDAEEKWKFATAQLHSAVSRLRGVENELEIAGCRLKSLEEERDRFRAAAIKAGTAASALAAGGGGGGDGEAAGLSAALEKQSARCAELLSKCDALTLAKETAAGENTVLKAEVEELRAALKAASKDLEAEKAERLAAAASRPEAGGGEAAEHKDGPPGCASGFEELAAGVARQVGNSIGIIRGHAEFCAETPDAEGAQESLEIIARNIVDLQKKIETIVEFSRPVVPRRSPERLRAVVEEVAENLRVCGRLGKAAVRVEGGEKLHPLGLDRARFAAAAEQLLLNAAEAMPDGGEIRVLISGSGGRQRLQVADSGPGIEKKDLGAVFRPFFTTKPGRMGLGLPLARNVAAAHGGSLELRADPGGGARAELELPEIF